MNLKKRMYRVKDAYLAPDVDEEFINGSPYGERSPKYNTFDYNEKCAIQRCKEQGGEWMVFIENIGGEPSYDFGMSGGLRVDEEFNAWGETPSRVLEIVENRNGKVYVEGVSEDVTTLPPARNYVGDSRRVKDARKIGDAHPYAKGNIQKISRVIKDFVKELEEIYPNHDFEITEYGVTNGDDGLVAMPEISGCDAYIFKSEEDARNYILDGYGADFCEGAAERDYWFKGLVGSGYSEEEANDILDRNDMQTVAESVLDSEGPEWFLGAYFGESFYVDDYVIYY